MNLKFWKPKQIPAGATVDEAALVERVNRLVPVLQEAGLQAMERAKNQKEQRAIIAGFKQMGALMNSLNAEQLSALLDCIEAGAPAEFKDRLRG